MIFYRITPLSIPKFLFACAVEKENYSNQFHCYADFMELSLIEKGRIVCTYPDGSTNCLSPGMFAPIFPDVDCTTKAYQNEKQGHITVGVQIKYEYTRMDSEAIADLTALQEQVRAGTCFLIPFQENIDSIRPKVLVKFKRIISLIYAPGTMGNINAVSEWFSLCTILTEFVLSKLDAPRKAIPPSAEKYISLAKDYIHENYAQKITVDALARHLSVSSGYLHRMFKATLGIGILEYANLYRVEIAKGLIKSQNFTLSEVANYVGINDVAYMCRLFKKVSGITYTQFKQDALTGAASSLSKEP